MWHVHQLFDSSTLHALPGLSFKVRTTGGVLRAEKYGCVAEFRRTPDGRYQMTNPPAVLFCGRFALLWDAGYQKFLVTDDQRKFPATADHLSSLRRFNEELRYALGIPAHYNEALGSTCHITAYDRLQGRPGDDPDKRLDIKPPADL
jgi:hypothetical protein